jgi:hypothetical protein
MKEQTIRGKKELPARAKSFTQGMDAKSKSILPRAAASDDFFGESKGESWTNGVRRTATAVALEQIPNQMETINSV